MIQTYTFRSEFNFPGLKEGGVGKKNSFNCSYKKTISFSIDSWCLCAERWKETFECGTHKHPKIYLIKRIKQKSFKSNFFQICIFLKILR